MEFVFRTLGKKEIINQWNLIMVLRQRLTNWNNISVKIQPVETFFWLWKLSSQQVLVQVQLHWEGHLTQASISLSCKQWDDQRTYFSFFAEQESRYSAERKGGMVGVGSTIRDLRRIKDFWNNPWETGEGIWSGAPSGTNKQLQGLVLGWQVWVQALGLGGSTSWSFVFTQPCPPPGLSAWPQAGLCTKT